MRAPKSPLFMRQAQSMPMMIHWFRNHQEGNPVLPGIVSVIEHWLLAVKEGKSLYYMYVCIESHHITSKFIYLCQWGLSIFWVTGLKISGKIKSKQLTSFCITKSEKLIRDFFFYCCKILQANSVNLIPLI